MIEDGDIGYAGNSHLSFVANYPARVGTAATAAGSAACAALVAALVARFPAVHESFSERRAVTPEQFRRARSRILVGA